MRQIVNLGLAIALLAALLLSGVTDAKKAPGPNKKHLHPNPKAVVGAIYQAFQTEGPPAFIKAVAPNVEWIAPMPGGPVWRGPDGVAQYWQAFAGMDQFKGLTMQAIFNDPVTGKAVAVLQVSGMVLKTKKDYTLEVVQLFTINKAGLITKWEEYYDMDAYNVAATP